jgi:hypothetical protein
VNGRISLRSRDEEINQCKFNTQNIDEFVTTSKKKVRFWENHMQMNKSLGGKDVSKIKGETLVSYEPTMIKKDDFGKDKESNRLFVQSEFLPEESSLQAVSATVDGQLIMWDMSLILEESTNVRNRREVKSINLLSSFNKVRLTRGMIVKKKSPIC